MENREKLQRLENAMAVDAATFAQRLGASVADIERWKRGEEMPVGVVDTVNQFTRRIALQRERTGEAYGGR